MFDNTGFPFIMLKSKKKGLFIMKAVTLGALAPYVIKVPFHYFLLKR